MVDSGQTFAQADTCAAVAADWYKNNTYGKDLNDENTA
jgi:hypothetical protein